MIAPYRSRHKRLTVPNVLSVLALLCGLGVLWRAGFANDLHGGLDFLLVGGGLCVLDGVAAELFNQHTELGDKQIQPLAGLTLGTAAVVTLWWHDHWPLWLVVTLGVVMVIFQFISFFAKFVPTLKRHQFWMHPIFTNAVIYAALVSFVILVVAGKYHVLVYIGAAAAGVALVAIRWHRYQEWFAGPAGQR